MKKRPVFSCKLKDVTKPLSIALILIVAVFIFSKKSKNNEFLLGLDLPDVVSTQSVFADPSRKGQPELPEFILLDDNSFLSNCPPYTINPKVLGALVEGRTFEGIEKAIYEYVVETGDNLWSISAKFDVSLNTILWANDLTQSSLIKPGQTLIIPSISGVIHHVKEGDTVGAIAAKYKGKTEEIISFNVLSGEADIYIGDILIVPDGVITASKPQIASSEQVPIGKSYFICPIASPCTITQGLHWYNAIDFSHGKCGEPIYAAAGGEVLKVKLTQSTSPSAFFGAGNHLTILHPNGVVTMYGHISVSFVNPGDQVSQGQVIALMGGQPGTPGAGRSTGCHLHFGVTGAANPFAR